MPAPFSCRVLVHEIRSLFRTDGEASRFHNCVSVLGSVRRKARGKERGERRNAEFAEGRREKPGEGFAAKRETKRRGEGVGERRGRN